jgi:hypothetical protein
MKRACAAHQNEALAGIRTDFVRPVFRTLDIIGISIAREAGAVGDFRKAPRELPRPQNSGPFPERFGAEPKGTPNRRVHLIVRTRQGETEFVSVEGRNGRIEGRTN